jgi:hypothetical protein
MARSKPGSGQSCRDFLHSGPMKRSHVATKLDLEAFARRAAAPYNMRSSKN